MPTLSIKTETISVFSSIISVVAVILLGIMMWAGCFDKNTNAQQQSTSLQSTHRSDTIDKSTGNIQAPTSAPVPSSSDKTIYVAPPYQQATNIDGLIKQNNELLEKYTDAMTKLQTINKYEDTLALRDSSGKQVGRFQYGDLVQNNLITKRSPSYSLTQRIITNTDTIPVPVEMHRTQVYGGLELGGNQSYYLNDVAAGFILKTKGDKIFKGNVTYDLHNNPLTPQRGLGFRVGFYPKISFRKNN